jgi:hypothetical protein
MIQSRCSPRAVLTIAGSLLAIVCAATMGVVTSADLTTASTASVLRASVSPQSVSPQSSSGSHRSAQARSSLSGLEVHSIEAKLLSSYRTEAEVRALENSPGAPACSAPAIPHATYPPGNSYGVPFLAAITDGEILAGYDEWAANNYHYKVGSKTHLLYPWESKVFDITGWVTGLIQLPSLSATISPQDIVFCDGGGAACFSASPPAGQCIDVYLKSAPVGSEFGAPVTNIPVKGKTCLDSSSSTYGCIPLDVVLTPSGDTHLTVTGVQSDGALDLRVTTSAVTTITELVSQPYPVCQNKATTVTLSTQAPSSLPPGAPIKPTSGNPDFRGLQKTPVPLTGPLATASSTAASNDFYVPAFPQNSVCTGAVPFLFNIPLAGYNTLPPKDAPRTNNYKGNAAEAGTPGWDQFWATTTVVTLGFPIGPPPGFNF